MFSSILPLSSCVIAIIEADAESEILDAIDMMNGCRAERKYLILLVHTFDDTLFKNITIDHAVIIEHRDGGDIITDEQ